MLCHGRGFRTPLALSFVEMVCEGHGNTVAQCFDRHLVLYAEDDASVVAEFKNVPIDFFEAINQRGLTMKIQGIFSLLRFDLIDPDQAATFGLSREITGLPPFQGFLKFPNTAGC